MPVPPEKPKSIIKKSAISQAAPKPVASEPQENDEPEVNTLSQAARIKVVDTYRKAFLQKYKEEEAARVSEPNLPNNRNSKVKFTRLVKEDDVPSRYLHTINLSQEEKLGRHYNVRVDAASSKDPQQLEFLHYLAEVYQKMPEVFDNASDETILIIANNRHLTFTSNELAQQNAFLKDVKNLLADLKTAINPKTKQAEPEQAKAATSKTQGFFPAEPKNARKDRKNKKHDDNITKPETPSS